MKNETTKKNSVSDKMNSRVRCDQCGTPTGNEPTKTGMKMRLCDECEPKRTTYEDRYAEHCMYGT